MQNHVKYANSVNTVSFLNGMSKVHKSRKEQRLPVYCTYPIGILKRHGK